MSFRKKLPVEERRQDRPCFWADVEGETWFFPVKGLHNEKNCKFHYRLHNFGKMKTGCNQYDKKKGGYCGFFVNNCMGVDIIKADKMARYVRFYRCFTVNT